MLDKNISVFRQELEKVKSQFEEKFQDIMISVRADRENDKQTLELATQNANNDKKSIEQNRALSDKLETMLNVQNLMLSQLRDMNEKVKDLSDQAGGGGGLGMLAGLGLAGAGVVGANQFLSGDGENTGNTGPGPAYRTAGGGGPMDNSTQNRTDTPDRSASTPDTTYGREFQSDLLGAGLSTEQGDLSPRELLARTMFAEAGAEGYESMLAVGQVMVNRTLANGFRDNLTDVILQKGAFSPWNSYTGHANGDQGRDMFALTPSEAAYRAADAIITGVDAEGNPTPNRVGRATHFVNTNISNPDWYNSDFFIPEGVPTQHYFGTATGERYPEIPLGDKERVLVESDRPEPSSSPTGRTETITSGDNFITGHLKEIGDVNGGMSLYNPTISGQQGRGAVHGSNYQGASNAVRAYWSADQLEAAGLSVGENTLQLTNPHTGQIESVSVNIQSFDGGNTYATTDFIGTDALGESREYWNGLTLEQSKKLVSEMGAGLGDINLRKKLNTYIQENEGIVVPYSEVDVPGPEDVRPLAVEREAQNRRIDQYFRRLDSPGTTRRRLRNGEDIVGDTVEPETSTVDESSSGDDDKNVGDPPVDTPPPEFDLSNPFPLVAPSRASTEQLIDALPTPQEPETEQPETPRTGGGAGTPMGGGAGSTSSQEPQIEANAIGRFPWAEKLIRYYNLSKMVKTNMLT